MQKIEAMLPRTEFLQCKRITDVDQRVIAENFFVDQPEGANLEVYLKNNALADEYSGEARTYLVITRNTNEIVGYFSLKAGFVSQNERPETLFGRSFDSFPGIELSNFAVNSGYAKSHPDFRNIGSYIFWNFVIPIVEITADIVGVKYLYIFALPYEKLIKQYERKYGFRRLGMLEERKVHQRIRPRYDDECVFMIQKNLIATLLC